MLSDRRVIHHKFKEKFTISMVIDFLTNFLCDSYKRNKNFNSVIRAALIRNVVIDDDYETTMLRLFPRTLASNEDYEPDGEIFFEQPNYYGLALYFLPNTPKTEIIKILDRDLPEAKRLYNELILKQRDMNIQTQDVIPNIQWYREWYWLHSDHSYQQIVNIESKKPEERRLPGQITRDRIIQGIKAYKKLLAMET